MARLARAIPYLASAALLAGGQAIGAQTVYQLDASVSYASFQGRARSIKIAGRSHSLHGSIVLPEANGRHAVHGDIAFTLGSLEVAPRLFQSELASVFETTPASEIIFSVDSVVRGTAPDGWHMDGRLTIRGVSLPVRFDGTAARIGSRIVAEGASTIDVRRWGIVPKPRVFGLMQPSPEVRLTFGVSFVPAVGAARASGMN
ncbi:MAG: YceI family protein [Gemmatimonadaceae bacterium]